MLSNFSSVKHFQWKEHSKVVGGKIWFTKYVDV